MIYTTYLYPIRVALQEIVQNLFSDMFIFEMWENRDMVGMSMAFVSTTVCVKIILKILPFKFQWVCYSSITMVWHYDS